MSQNQAIDAQLTRAIALLRGTAADISGEEGVHWVFINIYRHASIKY